jgi:hypothetical protein
MILATRISPDDYTTLWGCRGLKMAQRCMELEKETQKCLTSVSYKFEPHHVPIPKKTRRREVTPL